MAKKKEVAVPAGPVSSIKQDLSSVDKQYQQKLAMVEARPIIKSAAIFAWTAIDALLMIIFVGYIGLYLVNGSFTESREIASIANNIDAMHGITESHTAKPLFVGDAQVFTPQSGFADYYGELQNTNTDWTASFTYYFTSAGGQTEMHEGFIMPDETKPIVALHETASDSTSNPQLVVENVVWLRADAHVIDDTAIWLAEHRDFKVTDAIYTTDIEVDSKRIARSSFTIKNNTPYGYYEPVFLVLLQRAGGIVGASQVVLRDFDAGETRIVDLDWFGSSPTGASVLVVPNIDFFDVDAYLPASGSVEADIRDLYQNRRR